MEDEDCRKEQMTEQKFKIGDYVEYIGKSDSGPVIDILYENYTQVVDGNINTSKTYIYLVNTSYGMIWIPEEQLRLFDYKEKIKDIQTKLQKTLRELRKKLRETTILPEVLEKENKPTFAKAGNSEKPRRQAIEISLKEIKQKLNEMKKGKRQIEKLYAVKLKDSDYIMLHSIVNDTNECDKWRFN